MTKGERGANRHQTAPAWMKDVENLMRGGYLRKCGVELPDNIDNEFSFTQNGLRERDAGQTIWPDAGGGRFRLIVKWSSSDVAIITAAMGHQWVHIAGNDPGHGPEVKKIWDRLGRDPDVKGLANAVPGWKMREAFEEVLKEVGPFPGVPVDFEALRRKSLKGAEGQGEERIGADFEPKQRTYQMKCECIARHGDGQCGYTVRATSKHLDEKGAPICPVPGHGPMFVHPLKDAAKPRAKAEAAPEPLLMLTHETGYGA